MIVFYIGYCYNRQQLYFDKGQRIMMGIQNVVANARVYYKDQAETRRLWRHLNLMHIAAYTVSDSPQLPAARARAKATP